MSIRKLGTYRYRFECMVNRQRFSKTFHFYEETPQQIERKFIEWKLSCEKGNFINTNYTLEEFSKIWMDNYIKPNCTALVQRNYQSNLRNWILPELGKYNLANINPLMLDRFINKLKNSTTKYANRENKPLTDSTIKKVYENVKTMLSLAYKKGLITANPCSRVDLQFKRKPDESLRFWGVAEYKKVLDLLSEEKDTEKSFVVEFALKTGLRRSEMFGITWDDIDFDLKTISINKSRQKVNGKMTVLVCKTPSSVRTISIPQSLVDKLLKMRENSSTRFVFENIDYDNMTAWFRHWERKNNLPYIRFHDLRHTHASLLLYKGVDIKTISERLGHSNIGTTMNVYTHVMRELDVKASEAIEAI